MSDIVRVYRNLHNGKLSVQQYHKGIGWRVWYHTSVISLQDVSFKVSEAARQRTLRTKRKTVHAYVIGKLAADDFSVGSVRVSYNPYKAGTFVLRDSGAPIHAAYSADVYATGEIFI